jgi:hypothetical protein
LIASQFDTKKGNINLNIKHLWIKKATGLGISEFMLRFMAWLCLKDNALAGSQMCIVTGPRIDLAIALIDRMKKLFASSSGKGIATATAVTINNNNSSTINNNNKLKQHLRFALTTA